MSFCELYPVGFGSERPKLDAEPKPQPPVRDQLSPPSFRRGNKGCRVDGTSTSILPRDHCRTTSSRLASRFPLSDNEVLDMLLRREAQQRKDISQQLAVRFQSYLESSI